MKALDSPECQWIFQGNWIEGGDLGKGLVDLLCLSDIRVKV